MKKVREGYKMSELGEIPIEWQIKSINDICYVNPDTLSNKSDDSLSLEYIDIESVTTRRINEIKKLEFKDAPSRARRLIKRNDVIMSTVRPYLKAFAKINIEKDNLVCSTGFAVLRAKKNINHEFLFQSILSDYYIQQLSNKMVGSNYPAVNSSDVRESNIILPPLEEQEKIASILSTVDEQIDNVDALIEKNKELKKGLMQTLLTKGIGHTKFKKTEIGEIPEEWETINLGQLAEIKRGASPRPISSPKWFSEKKNVGWIRISDVTKTKKYLNDTEQYLSDEGVAKSRLVKPNDLIMSICATVGKPIILNMEACIHDGFVVFDNLDKNKILTDYLYYLLQKKEQDFKGMGQTGTQANLNTSIVGSTTITLPSLKEQGKIASILSEVDDKIEEYENKRQKLEELKKGLMQQLLTGMIRVEI